MSTQVKSNNLIHLINIVFNINFTFKLGFPYLTIYNPLGEIPQVLKGQLSY